LATRGTPPRFAACCSFPSESAPDNVSPCGGPMDQKCPKAGIGSQACQMPRAWKGIHLPRVRQKSRRIDGRDSTANSCARRIASSKSAARPRQLRVETIVFQLDCVSRRGIFARWTIKETAFGMALAPRKWRCWLRSCLSLLAFMRSPSGDELPAPVTLAGFAGASRCLNAISSIAKHRCLARVANS
jgi:hypothetical protein